MRYEEFFEQATGFQPYQYQVRLCTSKNWPDVLVGPTGIGKTAAIVLQWLWKSFFADDTTRNSTPRRLVYCLPQRTLVEQVAHEVEKWLGRLGLLAGQDESHQVFLHVLMGGSIDNTWESYPERRAILIGTQDQLLSRALGRGYGVSRYKWPVHFALLNTDVLWVCDELQLMDVGVHTTAQLQAFRSRFRFDTYGPAHTLWTSATFHPSWLETVDFRQIHPELDIFALTEDEKREPGVEKVVGAVKNRIVLPVQLDAENAKSGAKRYAEQLADEVAELHQTGTLTLVIVNRVQRAQAVFEQVRKRHVASNVLLVHSRFRATERARQFEMLRQAEHTDCVVVATQAVEAGIDISARTLITELAPWPNLVQRFGRCNRRGEAGVKASVAVVQIQGDKQLALPYTPEELSAASRRVQELDNFSPNLLPQVDSLKIGGLVLRRKDVLDFFDTSADLTGADVDISRYIRDNRDVDVHAYWRDIQDSVPDASMNEFQSAELCPVSLGLIHDYLKKTNHDAKRQVWVWDGLIGEFRPALDREIYPGVTLLLDSKTGGYSDEMGFSPDEWQTVNLVGRLADVPLVSNKPDNANAGDPDSHVNTEITLAQHLHDVSVEATKLLTEFSFEFPNTAVQKAASYHDCGKALLPFQLILGNLDAPKTLLAKGRHDKTEAAPSTQEQVSSSQDDLRTVGPDDGAGGDVRDTAQPSHPDDLGKRPGLRHELASALAYFEYANDGEDAPEFTALVAYLIASHHGKVRTSIRALPIELEPSARTGVGSLGNESTARAGAALFARGVHHGDVLPGIKLADGMTLPEVTLDLRPMLMGFFEDGRQSWTAMVLKLLKLYGPFRLAWLETLVRVADWRASAKEAGQ